MRISVFALLLALVTAACTLVDRRVATLGPPGDSCLATEADCTRSHQCCSDWCVNGECETREP
jgi:Dickkopf N-terminal cysteine-rich region